MAKKTIFIQTSTPPLPPPMKHIATDWILSTTKTFDTPIYKSIDDTTNLNYLRLEIPEDRFPLYIKYRYRYNVGYSPWYYKSTPVCKNYIIPPEIQSISIDTSTKTITVQTSPYSDLNNHTHIATDWIITTENGLPILQSLNDHGDLTVKTFIYLPNQIKPNKTYYIRARYIDNTQTQSLFTTKSFTT